MDLIESTKNPALNYKKFISDIISDNISDTEKNGLIDFLENDEKVAEEICKLDSPEFISLICTSPVLSAKDYAKKYEIVAPLYQGKIDCDNFIFAVLRYNAADVAPFLDCKHLNEIKNQYESYNRLLQAYYSEQKQLKEYIDFQKDNEKNQTGKSSKKKNNNKKLNEAKHRTNELSELIKLLHCSLDPIDKNISIIGETLKQYSEKRNMHSEMLFNNDLIKQHFLEHFNPSQIVSESAVLNDKIIYLEKYITTLQSEIKEKEKRIRNYLEMKIDADNKISFYEDEIKKLTDNNENLSSHCEAYRSIILNLNSTLANALNEPVNNAERLVFEMEDMNEPPQVIAEMLKEHINLLRNNFSEIKLNSSVFDNLPEDYKIELSSVDDSDNWENRTPVHFSDDNHSCKVAPGDMVIFRTRGFIYNDKSHNKQIIKADVAPYTAKNDKTEGE